MERVKLGEVLLYEQPTKYIVESDRYDYSYKTPVLTAGKSFILGYTDETNGIFEDFPVIIFDDFTTAIKYVDFPFKVKSSAMKILRPNKERADIKYLYYKMLTIKADSEQHKRYWISKYSQLEIPLPDLATQEKIAALLDKVDELCQYNKQLIEKYDALTQSLFLDMFGDPVRNEKGWEKKTVGEICSKIMGGGTPSKSNPLFYVGDIPWVTPKDMKCLIISDSIDKISVDAVNKSSAKLVPRNSILMVIRSGILKKKLPVALTAKEVTINQDMKAFIPNPEFVTAEYLLNFFMNIQGYLLTKVRAVTADNIEFKQIKELSIALPPLEVQKKFSKNIGLIEQQKELAQQALQKSEELFNSLLQKAFEGELVPEYEF